MQLIKCTKKLQKEIGLKAAALSTSEPAFSYLAGWHANLIFIHRRKCILFVNDKTLFSFIIPDVSRTQIKELSGLFASHLACILAEEDFSAPVREKILGEYANIEYASTNNKSVLGSMNDLAYHYQEYILSEGGVHSSSIPGIIKQLNRMPMGALNYTLPIEALKKLYGSAT